VTRIDQIIAGSAEPVFSFEFFPPKSDEGVAGLFETLARLKQLEPSFVSVTYGAGGSTRDLTQQLVGRIKSELGIEAMAHFTCVGLTVDGIRDYMRELESAGVENVIALRGDPPAGQGKFVKTEGGLGYADELVELLNDEFEFCIAGACYPEGHPEAVSLEDDLAHARSKVENGAKVLIAQMFFDNAYFFDFVERARAAGIDVPIVPGIMPIGGYEQINRFTSQIGVKIPDDLMAQLDARKDDPEAITDLGVAYATLQCTDLLARGAPGIHFYTLNKSPATSAILSALRAARPWERALSSGAAT
jgi:methylenetetrahydrofolate reductase (NADPH)